MTKIDFYRISGAQDDALALACKLTDKARRRGMTVLIHTEPDSTDALSTLLWSFQKTAFLPHTLDIKMDAPIAVTSENNPGEHHGLLISLTGETPSWFSRFERIAEIIYDDPSIMDRKREHFRLYKRRGYPLQYHDLTTS